jgi:y4mF family transcriptional regulator
MREIFFAKALIFAKMYRTGSRRLQMQIESSIEFGNSIRQARKDLGLTQPQVAGACGVGIRFIVDLEHGKPTCELDKALRVATILGLTIEINNRIKRERK